MGMPYRYQYDTSPKKLKPEYRRKNKEYPKKTTAYREKTSKKEKTEEIQDIKKKAKIIFYVLATFAIVFTISYRNSLIDEAYSKTESLKNEYSKIEKENEQIEVSIDNSLNFNNIEQTAKELLGMTKLNNKQTVYISLPKKDYIESDSGKEEKKEESLIDKIFNIF